MVKYGKYVFWGILAIAILCVGTYLGSCSAKTTVQKYNEQLKEAQANSAKVTAWADSIHKEALALQHVKDSTDRIRDSLATALRKRDSVIAARNVKIAQLKAHNDSIRNELASDTTCVNACIVALNLADSYRDQAERADSNVVDLTLQVADLKHTISIDSVNYNALQHSAALETMRADSLQKQVNIYIKMPGVKDPEKMFGFIKLPSRTASFFIGAGLATVGTVAFEKLAHIQN
jgi:uncharacterized coiled-coil DUF342 family protein